MSVILHQAHNDAEKFDAFLEITEDYLEIKLHFRVRLKSLAQILSCMIENDTIIEYID